MLTPEQLAARKIGGSDVATILGLNPYKTALELYAEKRGEVEPVDLSNKPAVMAGELLEAGIADFAQRKMTLVLGRPIVLGIVKSAIVPADANWITAHLDRVVENEHHGVEIKNVGHRMERLWGEEGTDDIPPYYLPQVHTYLLATKFPVWTVAGYFGGDDLRLYSVERDTEFEGIILDATGTFWHDHVLKGIPPEFDPGHPNAVKALKRVYHGTSGEVMTANEEHRHYLLVLEDAEERVRTYKTIVERTRAHLLHEMKDAAVLRFPEEGLQLTRKLVNRKGYTVEPTSYIDFRQTKLKGD